MYITYINMYYTLYTEKGNYILWVELSEAKEICVGTKLDSLKMRQM